MEANVYSSNTSCTFMLTLQMKGPMHSFTSSWQSWDSRKAICFWLHRTLCWAVLTCSSGKHFTWIFFVANKLALRKSNCFVLIILGEDLFYICYLLPALLHDPEHNLLFFMMITVFLSIVNLYRVFFMLTGTPVRFTLQVLTLPPHNPLRHIDFLFLDEETQVKLSYLSKFTQPLESSGTQHPGSEWPLATRMSGSFVVHTDWCSPELYSYPCVFKQRCYFKSVSPLQGVCLLCSCQAADWQF